jgi:hypothetical protein
MTSQLATLATRADEAMGPPPTKFYELRDNLAWAVAGALITASSASVKRPALCVNVVID